MCSLFTEPIKKYGFFKRFWISNRIGASSSTIIAFRLKVGLFFLGSFILLLSVLSASVTGNFKVKVLPLFNSLFNDRLPFNNSANFLEIVNPNPKPFCVLFLLDSACEKALKILSFWT